MDLNISQRNENLSRTTNRNIIWLIQQQTVLEKSTDLVNEDI